MTEFEAKITTRRPFRFYQCDSCSGVESTIAAAKANVSGLDLQSAEIEVSCTGPRGKKLKAMMSYDALVQAKGVTMVLGPTKVVDCPAVPGPEER